jgi:hypothetical protein
MASARGNESLFNLLLEHNVDVTATNAVCAVAVPTSQSGATALHLAASVGRESFVAMLLKRGSIVNARDSVSTAMGQKTTDGHDASCACLQGRTRRDRREAACVRCVRERRGRGEGAALSMLQNGTTPLMIACRRGYAAVVKQLLDVDADVTRTDKVRIWCVSCPRASARRPKWFARTRLTSREQQRYKQWLIHVSECSSAEHRSGPRSVAVGRGYARGGEATHRSGEQARDEGARARQPPLWVGCMDFIVAEQSLTKPEDVALYQLVESSAASLERVQTMVSTGGSLSLVDDVRYRCNTHLSAWKHAPAPRVRKRQARPCSVPA